MHHSTGGWFRKSAYGQWAPWDYRHAGETHGSGSRTSPSATAAQIDYLVKLVADKLTTRDDLPPNLTVNEASELIEELEICPWQGQAELLDVLRTERGITGRPSIWEMDCEEVRVEVEALKALAHITDRPSGDLVVLPPGESTVSVSKKLEDAERQRLSALARAVRPPGYGLIVRTDAEGRSQRDLQDDIASVLAELRDKASP